LVIIACLAGLVVVVFLFPPARLLGETTAQCYRDRVQVFWFRCLLVILGVHVCRHGRAETRPSLWVANHVSWLDIVVLGSEAPVTFVAKQDVAEWPLFGFLARRIGTLFLRRGDRENTLRVSESMTWLLRQGRTLVLFPEGTSSRGECVLRFHPRLFQPAKLAGVPVQPVALGYMGEARRVIPFIGDASFLPHLLRILTLASIPVELRYETTIQVGDMTRDELARRARQAIVEGLGASAAARRHVA
jgi:1-acyl-sn-glycerol-3-phosphate acyltransferase